ncbi:MAG: crossover junction endodeoxyribonuclease RuvC [Cytophagales bacterium]|nr:crossover junction endodeoxyribonuclease RuvC [Cytophagales bacterium]
MKKERIIVGIDPGTNVMGYGVIKQEQRQLSLLQYGVIHLHQYTTHELKLKKIFERVLSLINDFLPDEIALEAPFYGKNVQAMLKLGRAQGVAMAAALTREVPLTEYAPKKVKQAVTGHGNASKEQVAHMLMKLLQFKEVPKLLDASDALAVAVCHAYQREKSNNRPANWKHFVSENSERIHHPILKYRITH